ncbi:FG-GAP repeat domain-containing protein [Chitinophaga vietnamensis]|uniref:FG-GAP repeat domain-containing protein n=1 Tax=Chitinophaga vietnamensis TaxID=2593957 RepID=UPI0011785CAB|nr:VCBS repeat-containing protein [Chitinophaga vietnamensis]
MNDQPKLLCYGAIFIISLFIISSCHTPTREERGKALADKYCGTCHQPVSPALLDKETWTKHVLPAMAKRLGIRVWNETEYYPPQPGEKPAALSFAEWNEIVHYYDTLAPEHLAPAKPPVPLQHGWSVFTLKCPSVPDTSRLSATTLVAVDTASGNIFTSDELSNMLQRWGSDLHQTAQWRMLSPVVDMQLPKDSPAILTQIGNMRALNEPKGVISSLNVKDPKATAHDLKAFLQRPVQTLQADFNNDGLTDLLVCAFGHDQGGLYWLKQRPDHHYDQLPILEIPGAIHAVTGDFNKDGWTDVMALFAAGNEGIWLFENDKKGGFKAVNLLKFPPLNGSTSFQLADFNGDGKEDILYTCGDNADYSMILKPYHGVYIFLNEGNHQYKQAWFYPVNGCTKAIVADFNGDGRLDIATIAFFADLKNNPSEKFIFFEGDKLPLHFTPYAPPIEREGRWICMEAKDYDHDGDLDIVLGNYAKGFIIQDDYKPDWKEYQPFIVLENTSHHK